MNFDFGTIARGLIFSGAFSASYLLGMALSDRNMLDGVRVVDSSRTQRAGSSKNMLIKEGRSFLNLTSSTPSSGSKAEELKEQILSLALENPVEALDFVRNQVKPTALALEIERAILELWAVREPALAWKWTFENSYWQCCHTLKYISKVDAQLGWQFAKEFTARDPDNHFMSYMSHRNVINGRVYEGEYHEALQLALDAQYPSENEAGAMSKTLSHIFYTWTYHQPENAKIEMEKFVSEHPEYRKFAEEAYYAAISLAQPEEGLKLGQELPEDHPQKESVLTMAVTRLAESKPKQAIDFLHKNSDNPILDPQRRELAVQRDLIYEDIDAALKLAASVNQGDYRRDTYMDLMVEWSLQDPEKAQVFLAENQTVLSEEDRAQLKRTVKRKRIFIEREEYIDAIY